MNKNTINFNALKINAFSEKLFKILDSKLEPEIYILGISKDKAVIEFYCEPQNNKKYVSGILKYFNQKIDKIKKIDDFSNIVSEFEVISLLMEYFNENDERNNKKSYFSNHVTTDNKFLVVLQQFNRKQIETHYSLKNDDQSTIRTYASLLDAAIERSLFEYSKYLQSIIYERRSSFDTMDNEIEVIRWSGIQFVNSIAHKASNTDAQGLEATSLSVINNLYEDCNMISSLLYEGRESKGKIIIASKGHPNIEEVYILRKPVKIRNHRTIRKLLETCTEETYLLYSEGDIYGIGLINSEYACEREDLFRIIFKKHYNWTVMHCDNELMTVSYGFPKLTDKPFENKEVMDIIKKVFKQMSIENIHKVIELIDSAASQQHGSLIVFSVNAEEEAVRLKNQAIIFKPFVINKEALLAFTNIDGAMIIDPGLKCHAVGVILDGVATEKGSPSRGSRYNSAARYIESQKKATLAVVISEDGMVNFLF